MAIKLRGFQPPLPNRTVEEAPSSGVQPDRHDEMRPPQTRADSASAAESVTVADFEKRLAGWTVEDVGTRPGFVDPFDLIKNGGNGGPESQPDTSFLLLASSAHPDIVSFGEAMQAFQRASVVESAPPPEAAPPANAPALGPDASPRLSLDSFIREIESAAKDAAGIDDRERAALVEAMRRLAPEDQGPALAEWLKRGYARSYLACAKVVDTSARISLDSFREGVEAASKRRGGIETNERAALVEAMQRLPLNDQGAALEDLLKRGYAQSYLACAKVADTSARIGLESFLNGIDAASKRRGGIETNERAALVEAMQRVPLNDQGAALEDLLKRGYAQSYLACAEVADPSVRIGLKPFLKGIETASNRRGGIQEKERAALVEAILRMPAGDQERALEKLRRLRYFKSLEACSQAIRGP